jgi:hypothetical protein
MNRKAAPTASNPSPNGQSDPGDIHQPDQTTNSRFDPTTLSATEESAPTAEAAVSAALDPFNPTSLRLSEDYATSLGVKKALLTVPVRKPDKSWWVRVHPDEAYRLKTVVIELSGVGVSRETYLVAQPLWSKLTTEATFKPKLLVTAINRQGDIFIWELNLPRPDGRIDEWSRTALEAVSMAVTGWVRVAANQSLGAYEVLQATGQLSEPTWPEVSFQELLATAFKDRLIDSPQHPILRRLRGEV